MISNRRGARRSASPVERLREFAINTSKGIDVTQAPVNNDTVVHAKNLIVNPDGSMSLRKPLVCTNSMPHSYIPHVLFDGNFLLESSNNLELVTARGEGSWEDTAGTIVIDLSYYDYMGKEHLLEDFADDGVLSIFKQSDFKFINLNTATIIGGCNLDLKHTAIHGLVDPSLYDADVVTVPRYLKITHAPTADGSVKYLATILSPMPNAVRFGTDGELSLDVNTVLDNPYALQDTYGLANPVSKGILGYVYSTGSEGDPPKYLDLKYLSESTSASVPMQFTSPIAYFTIGDNGIGNTTCSTFWNDLSLGYKFTLKFNIEIAADYDSLYVSADLAWEPLFTNCVPLESVKINLYNIRCEINVSEVEEGGVAERRQELDVSLEGCNLTKLETSGSADLGYIYTQTHALGGALRGSCHIYINDEDAAKPISDRYVVTHSVMGDLKVPFTTVAELTESVKSERYRPVYSVENVSGMFLKAFGTLPPDINMTQAYWATWMHSYDGVSWECSLSPYNLKHTEDLKVAFESTVTEGDSKTAVYYTPYHATNAYDTLTPNGVTFKNRPDILFIQPVQNKSPLSYKFRIATLKKVANSDLNVEDAVDLIISEAVYNVFFESPTTFLYLEFPNTVYGNKLYHKKRIYSYGHEKFFNNIFVSGIDNFETPLYNVIDIDAKQSDTVSALIPWRDYLMSATTNAMYLHTPQDDGFLTKTVTTSLGIPKEDANCCVSVLNGVIIKSNSKVYLIYPNAYSGTDNVLNLAPISQPVDEYLQIFEDSSKHDPFAFSTESEYILMLPFDTKTMCLRYNYTTRIWCMCEYPVRLYDYRINNVEDVRLYGVLKDGVYTEFKFDSDSETYVDVIGETEVPIKFEWDSGQKTDNIATRKQFTESKIVFSTEDDLEEFPMELVIAVDGDSNVTRIDVRTDAPLIKTVESAGVLNTTFKSTDEPLTEHAPYGIIRQLIVRYSGRGRSVRHILTGTAKSPFRMYEAYVRYKLIDNKR